MVNIQLVKGLLNGIGKCYMELGSISGYEVKKSGGLEAVYHMNHGRNVDVHLYIEPLLSSPALMHTNLTASRYVAKPGESKPAAETPVSLASGNYFETVLMGCETQTVRRFLKSFFPELERPSEQPAEKL